jgi:hypothetical protein
MKVSTSDHLKVLSQVNQDIYNILSDLKVGRKHAVWALDDLHDVQVSEKLIRTWRENIYRVVDDPDDSLNEDNVIQMADYHKPDSSDPEYFYTIKAKTINGESVTISLPPASGQTVSYKEYLSTTPVFKSAAPESSKKDQKVIAFGDFQINKHDPEFLGKAIAFVKDQQPDMICLTGDESDNSAVGRWAKGMREEFESNLQDQIDETVDWLWAIRDAAPNAQIHMAHSNHMDWITKAVETRIPGFSSLRALTPEVMYDLDELGIQYQRKLFEFLPGFLLGHGHQWSLTSSTHTAKGIEHVLKTGKSILAGHVHQAALRTVFVGYEGKGEQKVYVNPGCMMDFDKAMASNGGYINGTSPNWSKGIAVITREAGQNYTELVLGETNGTFRYEGRIY